MKHILNQFWNKNILFTIKITVQKAIPNSALICMKAPLQNLDGMTIMNQYHIHTFIIKVGKNRCQIFIYVIFTNLHNRFICIHTCMYSWTSVIQPSVIRISLLSGHDLAVYIVYFQVQLNSCSRQKTKYSSTSLIRPCRDRRSSG